MSPRFFKNFLFPPANDIKFQHEMNNFTFIFMKIKKTHFQNYNHFLLLKNINIPKKIVFFLLLRFQQCQMDYPQEKKSNFYFLSQFYVI